MCHPLTTAILKRDLQLVKELAAKHEKELNTITSKVQNAPQEGREPAWEYVSCIKWHFLPEDGNHDQSVLETAAESGWLPGVKVLLDHGASVQHTPRQSYYDPPCALLWACKQGHADVVRLLLDYGADINCTHSRGENSEVRCPLKVTLDYCRLEVLKVLVEFGVNINEQIQVGYYDRPPLVVVCHKAGLPLFRYLIGTGANLDVEGSDFNGTVGLLAMRDPMSQADWDELMILFMQVGYKISVESAIGLMQDWYDHMGGRQAPFPEELREYHEGRLYSLTIQDRCRIKIRRKLIKKGDGCSILPAIKKLPLPMKMKKFISFDCLGD